MKVAVIGCGTISNMAYIPAHIKNQDAEIKCFCDIIPERAEDAVKNTVAVLQLPITTKF